MRRRKWVTLLALVALAGCTRTKTLDAQGLEEMLRSQVEQQLGAQGITVDCPDDEPAAAGTTFRCTATGTDGTTIGIEVTQTDDQGHVTWKATKAG